MKNTLPDPDSRHGATETGGEFEFPLELEDDRPPTSDPFDFVYSERPAPRAPLEWDWSADGMRTTAASEWRRRVFRLSLLGALLAGALFAVPIVQRGNLSSFFDWNGSAPSTDASAPEPAPAPETLPPVIADTPPAATTPVPDASASAPAAVPHPPIDTASPPRIERDQSQSAVAAAPPPPSASSARPSSIETARKPPPVETSARSRRAEAPKPPARVVLPPPLSQAAPAPTTASAPAPTPPPPSAPTSPLSPQTASAPPAPASDAATPSSDAAARVPPSPAAAPSSAPPVTPSPNAAAPATTPTPPASTASASSSAPAAASAAAAPRPAAPIVDRSRETDTRAIDGALARYRNAFNTLNAGAAAEVWPSVDKRTLTRAFEQLKEQRIAFDGCQTDIKDTRAQAVCTGLTRYVPRIGGRLQVDRRQWTFNLARVKDEWVIQSVDAR